MHLDDCRALKAELLGERRLRTVATRASLPRAARAVALSALPERSKPTAMALGVRRVGKTYRLAVRLHHAFPGANSLLDEIRSRAKGEIDVRVIGRVVKQVPWHQKRNRPLRIGGSVGHLKVTAGTLGCFVSDGGQDDLILSNNHVLANENHAAKGDSIVQPGKVDGGNGHRDRVARLEKFVRLKKTRPNLLDCATARLEDDLEYYFDWLEGLGPIAGIRQGPLDEDEPVFKVGRTTGLTEGVISALEVDDLEVEYDDGDLRFDDQLEVAPAGNEPFSLGGDSGSLIVDGDRKAVALLFAGNDADATYANPIQSVLDVLGVALVF
jgi:hypothetical protein